MTRFLHFLLIGSLLVGCGEDEVAVSNGQGASAQDETRKRRKKGDEEPKEEALSLPPPVDFQETAFIESERSRDPFRNYAKVFVDEARGQVRSQREVILEQYAIDELRLVALIQRIDPPRAMLVDP